MAVKLDSIAVELAAIIGGYLNVTPLCSLRLVSKPIKRLFTPVFRLYLQHQAIDLTRSSLERLCELAANKELSSAVCNLRLTCLYFFEEDSTQDSPNSSITINLSGQDQTWIAEQKSEQRRFTGQLMCTLLTKALNGLPCLRNIALDAGVALKIDRRLEVEYVRSFAWSVQWSRAFQAYQVLLAAITYSGAHLDTLVIFQNQRTRKCSIPTHEITMPLVHRLETEGFATVGSRIKAYTVSLAMTTRPHKPDDQEDTLEETESHEPVTASSTHPSATSDDKSNVEVDFEGVSSLLRLMPNLEFLQIHLYPGIIGPVTLPAYHSFLPTLLQEHWYFPRLRELRLLGVLTTQEALQKLILRHAATLQTLSLENVVLTTGSWDPIFTTLSQQASSLVSLRLSLLGVGENRIGVNLEPVDENLDASEEGTRHDMWSLGDESFWHTRCIGREEIRKGLRFRPIQSRSPFHEEGLSFYETFHTFYVLNCRCCS
ncbi:hypothetical protein N431DRAFT_554852 [Stipitochalara longipes BDJ]|nr:hypothetical protein N431DRAFT_554852 [Stipitochalara longipes BDJ]